MIIKRIIRLILKKLGFNISRNLTTSNLFRNEQMIEGIRRISKVNLQINSIIDVGAAEGSWSLGCLEIFPESNYLMFEPLTERESELNKICENNANFRFVPKAAGEINSTINFKVAGDLDGSGIASGNEKEEEVRVVEIVRLDEEVIKHKLNGPYLIKLDTHGFEVPIIGGCEKILNEVNLFIIECYGFHLTQDSLLFGQMCDHMLKKGFRLFDVVDIMRRPKDGAFWQCDAFFIPKNHPIFEDNSYQ